MTFEALRKQVALGLNVGLAGFPLWGTDIGGFGFAGKCTPELYIRWFQFGAFCPIFRLHGHRLPNTDDFNGAANEVWSFGEPAYQIIKKYMLLRERLRPYVMKQMSMASETGIPLMRPLFVDFPSDPVCYQVEDEYLFGADLLVAPILDADIQTRNV